MDDAIESESIIIDILEAVSAERDIDPMHLSPLAEFMDPEALERVLTSAEVPLEITFELYGCRVTINESGNVTAVRASDAH